MISSVDQSSTLILDQSDFTRALAWLVEAEAFMPEVFKFSEVGSDAKAHDEIWHYIMINDHGNGVPERSIIRFASTKMPQQGIVTALKIMISSGRIKMITYDEHAKVGTYAAIPDGSP
jgi:hypothetical protein